MKTKTCSTCGRSLTIDNFYKCGKTKYGDQRYANECIGCRKEREKKRYNDLYLKLMESKRKCVHCGNNKWYLLEYHHRDPSKKEFTISHWRKRSREKLLKEIKECDALCKNCHAEFHFLNRKYGISYSEYLKNF